MNDAWFNPDTSGQGVLITVLPSYELVFLAMFTFDTAHPPAEAGAVIGTPGHRWLTALGSFEGPVATLDVELTGGGTLGPGSPPVEQSIDGTMILEFNDCANAVLTYDLPATGVFGSIPLVRAAPDNVVLCEALSEEAGARD
jgi:hypothetical protein